MKQTLLSVAVILATAFVAACLDNETNAQAGGVSRAEFDALLARVVALEANRPGDKVFAGDGTGGAFHAKAATADGKPLGTMVGHLPANVSLSQSQFFSLKSASGYLYAVSNSRNANGQVGLATYAGDGATGSRYVYFSSDDCVAVAHVPGADVSDYGASQGLVFMIGAGEFNEVINNPAQYLYIPSGAEQVTGFNYASRMARVGFCEAATGTLATAYSALPNAVGVTGVDSGPVPTPVSLVEP